MKSAKLNIRSNKQCKQVWNIIFSSFFPYIGTKNNVMIEKNSTWYCIEELIENCIMMLINYYICARMCEIAYLYACIYILRMYVQTYCKFRSLNIFVCVLFTLLLYMWACVLVCMCVCVRVYMHMCMVRAYVCVRACVRAYVYMYHCINNI